MKLSLELTYQSSKEWIDCVMNDFDSFLQDHADCERKASAMAMSFIAKCPDRTDVIPKLIETGIEELEHFQDVYNIMEKRGIQLNHEIPQDLYIKQLINACRSGRDDRLMDRMLIASIVECRGAERFKMIADALEDMELKSFYKRLWTSEAKHGNLFVNLALNYWDKETVYKRLNELNEIEGIICSKLPIRPALH
ncbi:MAG: tRNA-(ms[2]io[6]A)-hydroxylase [Flavobacteriales bacterium]|nr:tRNA-(ms[2]io[6]A)-hydroxylase [Flavobacteriales bacterium]